MVTLSHVGVLSVMPKVVLICRGCPTVYESSWFLSNNNLRTSPAASIALQTANAASRLKISRRVSMGSVTSGCGPYSDWWSSLVASTVRLWERLKEAWRRAARERDICFLQFP